jgi:1-acyl-sn-glycerol-3-phosphate acyltransferase
MTLRRRLVDAALHGLINVLCRVDEAQLAKIPQRGPLILVANHVNFLEIPVLYTRMGKRPLRVLAKAETWGNPFKEFLFDLSMAIPVQRGEVDTSAVRLAVQALEAGHILAVAPEGTRSGDGQLQRGHPGVLRRRDLLAQPAPLAANGFPRRRGRTVRAGRTGSQGHARGAPADGGRDHVPGRGAAAASLPGVLRGFEGGDGDVCAVWRARRRQSQRCVVVQHRPQAGVV